MSSQSIIEGIMEEGSLFQGGEVMCSDCGYGNTISLSNLSQTWSLESKISSLNN